MSCCSNCSKTATTRCKKCKTLYCSKRCAINNCCDCLKNQQNKNSEKFVWNKSRFSDIVSDKKIINDNPLLVGQNGDQDDDDRSKDSLFSQNLKTLEDFYRVYVVEQGEPINFDPDVAWDKVKRRILSGIGQQRRKLGQSETDFLIEQDEFPSKLLEIIDTVYFRKRLTKLQDMDATWAPPGIFNQNTLLEFGSFPTESNTKSGIIIGLNQMKFKELNEQRDPKTFPQKVGTKVLGDVVDAVIYSILHAICHVLEENVTVETANQQFIVKKEIEELKEQLSLTSPSPNNNESATFSRLEEGQQLLDKLSKVQKNNGEYEVELFDNIDANIVSFIEDKLRISLSNNTLAFQEARESLQEVSIDAKQYFRQRPLFFGGRGVAEFSPFPALFKSISGNSFTYYGAIALKPRRSLRRLEEDDTENQLPDFLFN